MTIRRFFLRVSLISLLICTLDAQAQKLTLGGYGEVALSRNFYSDNVYRYSNASLHKGESHGRFDVPHAVFYVGYDFGKGWSMQSEIEFEHLGTGTEVEKEFEEAGEWEAETERGGEVELEQFWIQKSFMPQLNVRMGHIVVPVGGLNNAHEPLNFFTVYRPEGEATVLPSTWHDTGVSIWGTLGSWKYELLVVSGLDAMMFGRDGFINGGANTPFKFQVANTLGFAARIDKSFLEDRLKMGVSGYAGNTLRNTFPYEAFTNASLAAAKGTLLVGAYDFSYKGSGWIVRGNADYGYLKNAGVISNYKSSKGAASGAPYESTPVGDMAMAFGFEAGYDLLNGVSGGRDKDQQLYLFGRCEWYNPYVAKSGQGSADFTEKMRVAAGINWFPIPQIAVKAEYSHRFLSPQYNNEPSISIGVAYAAFFNGK